MWETSLQVRVPLLIKVPGRATSGATTASLTELVDVHA